MEKSCCGPMSTRPAATEISSEKTMFDPIDVEKSKISTSEHSLDSKHSSSAKKRWQILKQALLKGQKVTSSDSVSVRRFCTFGLLSTKQSSNEKQHTWLQYNCSIFPDFKVDIRHLTQQIKVDDLIGFNNTGNVCVWPSEEVLSYYCLKNKSLFRDQTVCELGGGMTCLAGVIVAMCSQASEVLLTDGNINSITNVNVIIEKNKHAFGNTRATGRELRWNEREKFDDLYCKFDHIICADCLFFDQYRQDLVDTIDSLLKPGGLATIFAPHRGTTMQSFCELARIKFRVDTQEKYDSTLWQKHEQLLSMGKEVYDENIHYPIFITLKKKETLGI